MTYLGLDPGASGGIGVVYSGYAPFACKWPGTEADVWRLIMSHAPATHAVLESVHSMPGQGVASSFKFGKHFGMLVGMLTAAGIPYTLVRPQAWQKTLGCLTGGDKNVSKRRAQQLYPNLKITHATADALLLATYCRQVHP